MTSRDYQIKADNLIHEAWIEDRCTLLVMATGCGKTHVASRVIRRRFPRRTMFLAHRQELVWQAKNQIERNTGLRVDVEMGEHKARVDADMFHPEAPVIVSTIQTQTAGGDGGGRMTKFDPMDFGLLIVDEAHHSTSISYRKLINYYMTNPNLVVLGLTATPDRADEESLGQVFGPPAMTYDILDGVKDGWLLKPQEYSLQLQDLDFSHIKPTSDDLNSSELEEVMKSEKVVQGMVQGMFEVMFGLPTNLLSNIEPVRWARKVEGRQPLRTLAFTCSVSHSIILANIFNRLMPGMAVQVDGTTDTYDRNKINRDFDSGKIPLLCNCGTHTEGFDSPGVELVVPKPTKSRSLYAQMLGRAMRTLPGVVDGDNLHTPELRHAAIRSSNKPYYIALDFWGNTGKHKLITPADIMGCAISDVVIEEVIAAGRKCGRKFDVHKELEEKEARYQEKQARQIEEESKKSTLVGRATYSVRQTDPFDLLDLKPYAPRGWDRAKPISDRMRKTLLRGGINPDALSYTKAKQLVGALINRWDKHLCSLKQAKILRSHGYSIDLTFEQAKQTIDRIAHNNWRRPDPPGVANPFSLPENAPLEDDNIPF